MTATLVGTPDPDEPRQASNVPLLLSLNGMFTGFTHATSTVTAPVMAATGSATVNILWTLQHQGPY